MNLGYENLNYIPTITSEEVTEGECCSRVGWNVSIPHSCAGQSFWSNSLLMYLGSKGDGLSAWVFANHVEQPDGVPGFSWPNLGCSGYLVKESVDGGYLFPLLFQIKSILNKKKKERKKALRVSGYFFYSLRHCLGCSPLVAEELSLSLLVLLLLPVST